MSDWEIIKRAVLVLLKITEMFRYGGMLAEYELAQRAAEAVKRVEKPTLPGLESK